MHVCVRVQQRVSIGEKGVRGIYKLMSVHVHVALSAPSHLRVCVHACACVHVCACVCAANANRGRVNTTDVLRKSNG